MKMTEKTQVKMVPLTILEIKRILKRTEENPEEKKTKERNKKDAEQEKKESITQKI